MNCIELQEALKTQGSKFVFNQVLLNEDVYILRERYQAEAPPYLP